MIRAVVAEDSPTLRALLVHALSADPEIRVVAEARDGQEACEAVERLRPDVVTMDVHMPVLDGFEATRRIMESSPVPIVIVSGTLTDQVTATFRALNAGALAFVPRPEGPGHPMHQKTSDDLVRMVKLMAEVKVVRRWRRRDAALRPPAPARRGSLPSQEDVRVVAIGASTGGPVALQIVLSALPKNYPVPVLVVQHMAPGFIDGLAQWLGESCPLPVRVASAGQDAKPGHVYLAPDGAHMALAGDGCIALSGSATEYGMRPAVAYLFRSVAKAVGGRAIGVLLSGMGKDGAAELKDMRDLGAVTIAQDRESSVVHGMPGEAIALEGAVHVLAPNEIGDFLAALKISGSVKHVLS
ncbi:MAG: chemotaxis-specific protein-glutamate methyltransferase CheB [Alphaproteobacteria bacterium]